MASYQWIVLLFLSSSPASHPLSPPYSVSSFNKLLWASLAFSWPYLLRNSNVSELQLSSCSMSAPTHLIMLRENTPFAIWCHFSFSTLNFIWASNRAKPTLPQGNSSFSLVNSQTFYWITPYILYLQNFHIFFSSALSVEIAGVFLFHSEKIGNYKTTAIHWFHHIYVSNGYPYVILSVFIETHSMFLTPDFPFVCSIRFPLIHLRTWLPQIHSSSI